MTLCFTDSNDYVLLQVCLKEVAGNTPRLPESARIRVSRNLFLKDVHFRELQGDPSGSSKPIVDIDLKGTFQYKVLILKRNFHINVNDRF